MKREGIIFMNEGGRDNGIPEIKPAMPAPVESGESVVRKPKDKSSTRQVKPPERSGVSEKSADKGILFKIAKIKAYFDNPDEIDPANRVIMEKDKVEFTDEEGQEAGVSILEFGKFCIDEAVNVFRKGKLSPRILKLINAADKYITDHVESDEKFREGYFKRLGGGNIEAGKKRWEEMREGKEALGIKAVGDAGSTDKKDEPTEARVPGLGGEESKREIEEISEMMGIDKDDFNAILSAPIDGESAKKLFEDAGILPAPLQSDGGGLDQVLSGNEGKTVPLSQAAPVGNEAGSGADNAATQAEGGSGGGGGDEVKGGSSPMGAGIPAAPMGSGDYEKFDGSGSGDKNKLREGDRHKRLKDFLKRHFGKEALFIYVLMLLALYCGAVYHTARVLEENAERSRAGRSQI